MHRRSKRRMKPFEGVQGAAKSETTGTEANVVTEAAGTVGNSADVVAGTSAVDARAQEPQMVQEKCCTGF